MKKMLGYTPEEVVGKKYFYDFFHPEDKEELKEGAFGAFKLKQPFHDTINRNVHKNGNIVWLSTAGVPILDDKGELLGYRGSDTDITEQKKAEKDLSMAFNELALVNEKLGVVGRLTRHDVRNKLSAVTGNIYLAKQALPADCEVVKYLNETESAVDQIEKIFDFARTYEQLGLEELSNVDVGKSFERATSLLADLSEITVVNDCGDLKVLADSLLDTLFYNLMDNSLKHGEKVSKIRVYCKTHKDDLTLVYEDDGVGVSEAEKEKIFGEGYGKGTGIGLHMIKLMCNIYGWTIKETGKQGKGAQFIMSISKTNENTE